MKNQAIFQTIVYASKTCYIDFFEGDEKKLLAHIVNHLKEFTRQELDVFFQDILSTTYSDAQLNAKWEAAKPDFFFTPPAQIKAYFKAIETVLRQN